MSFNWAQSFYLPSAVVAGSCEVGITGVDLYFRGKPKESGNKSGISSPGVEVTIAATIAGIPNISETGVIRPTEPTEHGSRFNPRFEVARREYGEIIATTDASAPTRFEFTDPIFVPTDYEYAVVIKFDGNEDFVLWTSKAGDKLVGNNQTSPGPSGKYIGALFDYIGAPNPNVNPSNTGLAYSNTAIDQRTANDAALLNADGMAPPPNWVPDPDYLITNWKAISDTSLKFAVYVARYAHNGFPVASNNSILNNPALNTHIPWNDCPPIRLSNNLLQVCAQSLDMEYIAYDIISSHINTIREGELIFQKGIRYPGGTATPLTISVSNTSANIVANPSYAYANGATFMAANGFHNIFSISGGRPEYIVIDGGNKFCIRRVQNILANNVLDVGGNCSFTNSAAYFYRAPIGLLFGMDEVFIQATQSRSEIMVLAKSTANSTVRFVNNTIESITITANGSGYSNSDYIVINGYEAVTNKVLGGYSAVANIHTNPGGNVVAIYLSNAGCGFVNPSWLTGANVSIKNSQNQTATGTGLTMTFNIGATMLSADDATNYYGNCTITNLTSHRLKPEVTVNNPLGTAFTLAYRNMYKVIDSPDTFNGRAYLVNEAPVDVPLKIFKSHDISSVDVLSVCPSRSNQYVIGYANGALPNNQVIGNFLSNSAVYVFTFSSNNDYLMPFFEPEIINAHYGYYLINDDYTNENTNYGNAVAKHVATKVNLQTDFRAEDLIVWLTLWRPANTDVKVFARVYNSLDPEAFDDKDWTLMEETDGIGVYSSSTDTSDFIETQYNFPKAPNTMILDGTVNVSATDAITIYGSGTTFTSDLQVNDLIKITNALFPNSYYIGVVADVTDNATLTIQQPVANNDLVGEGFIIEKITYPKQAFDYGLNSNVVRYYNESLAEFDTFDTFQLKVVMLSDNDRIVPKFDDIRAVAVTA